MWEKFKNSNFSQKFKEGWKRGGAVVTVFCLVLALAVKEGLKALDVFDVVQITFLLSAVRYFLMVFVVAGLFPLLMKKIKL